MITEQISTDPGTKILTKFAIVSMKSSIRAITRIVHLKLKKTVGYAHRTRDTTTYPTRSIKLLAAIGMTVPPSDEPVAIIPNANDLRLLNHCEAMAGSGPKTIPQANPVRMPWQRSSCQNSLHSAVRTVATTRITLVIPNQMIAAILKEIRRC